MEANPVTTLAMISCTKKKYGNPCKASEMYSASHLFKKAYAYCTKKHDQVVILSAKYGLLLPEEVIKPYDETLRKMTNQEVKQWSENVFKAMQEKLDLNKNQIVFFYAGKLYRKYLTLKLEAIGIDCKTPLQNLGIGKQLKWYNEQLDSPLFKAGSC